MAGTFQSDTGGTFIPLLSYERCGNRTIERRTEIKENGEKVKTVTEDVDTGETLESVTVSETDGRELERRLVKRIKNSLGRWCTSEETCFRENEMTKSERYEYLDPECELFKLTSINPQDGLTEVYEYDAEYWDQPD